MDAQIRDLEPLVETAARWLIRQAPASVTFDQLMQAGRIALFECLQRYDGERGVQFSTFASDRIRGAMWDEMRAAGLLGRAAHRRFVAVDVDELLELPGDRDPADALAQRQLRDRIAGAIRALPRASASSWRCCTRPT